MLFSSITFLYYFLPVFLITYLIVPGKLKNMVILLGSIFFYAWGEPKYLILMLVTIILGYSFGLLISKSNQVRRKKFLVAIFICICLGLLGYFKYADFVISIFNSVTGNKLAFLEIALPIGISFYIFQAISYVIDVYRDSSVVQKNVIKLATYISMFPQLIAGPIVRYKDISSAIESRVHQIGKISYGIRRFVIGLGKKILIANTLGQLADLYRQTSTPSVLYAWLYAIAITLQIYFDFSGYSDMAIGLGKIMGFDFPENFNYPFLSKSITEFWRRWHMTLGSWFRDYLYIPMGGNRVKRLRWFLNIFIVWAATGLWHGASMNFVIWGIYFALLLIIEKLFLLKKLNHIPIISNIYLLILIVISFVIFDGSSLLDSINNLKIMFGFSGLPFSTNESLFEFYNYGFLILVAAFGATDLPAKIINSLKERTVFHSLLNILEPVFIAALLLICTGFLVNGSFNPFLYFRF